MTYEFIHFNKDCLSVLKYSHLEQLSVPYQKNVRKIIKKLNASHLKSSFDLDWVINEYLFPFPFLFLFI